METKNNGPRIIISGGGTGGHIFPAVSIANAIKELRPDAEILFVGAEGRMEMQRVPDAGYKIIGLPRCRVRPKTFMEKCCCYREITAKPVEGAQDSKRIPPASGRRCRRLCQWSYPEGGRHDGGANSDTRAKLLCRSN